MKSIDPSIVKVIIRNLVQCMELVSICTENQCSIAKEAGVVAAGFVFGHFDVAMYIFLGTNGIRHESESNVFHYHGRRFLSLFDTTFIQ